MTRGFKVSTPSRIFKNALSSQEKDTRTGREKGNVRRTRTPPGSSKERPDVVDRRDREISWFKLGIKPNRSDSSRPAEEFSSVVRYAKQEPR